MMPPRFLEAGNSAFSKEQSVNNDAAFGAVAIQIVDSRDDLFSEQEDQRHLSDEPINEEEVTEVKDEAAAAADVANDDTGLSDVQMVTEMVTELRESLLALRRINCRLQSEVVTVKEENLTLVKTVKRMDEDRTTLKGENEQLRKELELLKTGTEDRTCPSNEITSSSTLSEVSSATSSSLLGDQVFDFDENSYANDLCNPPFTIDTDFQYTPIAQEESIDSDDILDNQETTKLLDSCNKSRHSRNMSDLTPSMKSRDTLYDIDELKITTTTDNDDEEDVTVHMKLELKRDQCKELQRDLEKIAEAFWEQTEELKECRSNIDKLQTENDQLKCLKWIEAEIDAMWKHVKEVDKVKHLCESLLIEKEELEASVEDKSNQIAELNAKLQNSLSAELVQSKVDDIQNDLGALLAELKACVVEKSNEIEELKAKLRNAPCPDWIALRMDDIQKEVEVLLIEREELKASVISKTDEIAELKAQLQNSPCPDWVHERLDDIQKDVKQMKIEQRRHSYWK